MQRAIQTAILFALLIALLPFCLIAQESSSGQIAGTLLSPDGQPVARATVLAQLEAGPGAQPFRANAFSGPDGSFLVSNLPAGQYRICIQVPGTAFLDPCTWSAAPPSATVAAGQTASAGNIQVETGYLVKARLTDSNRLLQADEGRVRGVHLQIGIWTPEGFFVPMRVRTRRAGSRDLELPVPFGTAVALSARSGSYDLTNETNTRVDPLRGARIPIQAAPDTPPTIYTFRITGRRAAP